MRRSRTEGRSARRGPWVRAKEWDNGERQRERCTQYAEAAMCMFVDTNMHKHATVDMSTGTLVDLKVGTETGAGADMGMDTAILLPGPLKSGTRHRRLPSQALRHAHNTEGSTILTGDTSHHWLVCHPLRNDFR